MNKLSDLTILKQLLKEKQNKLSTLKYEYEAIVEQEPYMRNRLKNRQYSMHKLAGEIKSIEKEIKTMESKHLQDSMEILRLSGFTTDADPTSYLNKQVWVRHEANGQVYKGLVNKEAGNMIHVVLPATGQSAWKSKNQVELVKDSDCGEKVYTKGESTEDECKDGGPGSGIKGHTTSKEPSYTSRSGYNFEEPKVIEAAIKKVKESGHPDVHYLSGLERALYLAKKERGMKDDDATEMGAFEQLGQNHETEAMEPEKNPVQAQDGIRFVTWVKPSGLEYQIGDIIQFKGKNVKVTKITGNVVEAQVMDACTKDEEVGEKFKTVMEEFGKGELKSSSGETVTDPEQAKAIAYSEQREAKDSDPKVTEAKKLIDLFGGAM